MVSNLCKIETDILSILYSYKVHSTCISIGLKKLYILIDSEHNVEVK